jgi:hypothetical protein
MTRHIAQYSTEEAIVGADGKELHTCKYGLYFDPTVSVLKNT